MNETGRYSQQRKPPADRLSTFKACKHAAESAIDKVLFDADYLPYFGKYFQQDTGCQRLYRRHGDKQRTKPLRLKGCRRRHDFK